MILTLSQSEMGKNLMQTHKGIDPLVGTLHGGWGFHCWEETVEGEPEFVMHSAAAANAMVEDGSVTNDPVFSIAGTQLNNRNATQDDIWLSLAKHVPAVSSPVGGMVVFQMSARNINMEVDGEQGVLRPNGWGRNHDVYQESWLHSDMKDMAFLYVYKLYEQLITRGNLQ